MFLAIISQLFMKSQVLRLQLVSILINIENDVLKNQYLHINFNFKGPCFCRRWNVYSVPLCIVSLLLVLLRIDCCLCNNWFYNMIKEPVAAKKSVLVYNRNLFLYLCQYFLCKLRTQIYDKEKPIGLYHKYER